MRQEVTWSAGRAATTRPGRWRKGWSCPLGNQTLRPDGETTETGSSVCSLGDGANRSASERPVCKRTKLPISLWAKSVWGASRSPAFPPPSPLPSDLPALRQGAGGLWLLPDTVGLPPCTRCHLCWPLCPRPRAYFWGRTYIRPTPKSQARAYFLGVGRIFRETRYRAVCVCVR